MQNNHFKKLIKFFVIGSIVIVGLFVFSSGAEAGFVCDTGKVN